MRGAGRAFAPGFQATALKACFSCPRAGNSARPLVRNPPFPLHFPHYVYHASYVCSIIRANSPFPRFFSRKSYQWRLRFAYTAGDEGAAARLAWNRMPRKPCTARLPGSGARTFAPLRGGKVTAFLKAVEKVQGLFRQPERRPPFGGRPSFLPLFIQPATPQGWILRRPHGWGCGSSGRCPCRARRRR